jgi:hypothetical protein
MRDFSSSSYNRIKRRHLPTSYSMIKTK